MATIGQIIRFLESLTSKMDSTVDGLLMGSLDDQAIGVATAFSATQYVVEEAARQGLNLLITHEGAFYSHHGGPEWIIPSSVYQVKRKWIEDNGINVYRFHDGWHHCHPDGVSQGLIHTLGWESYVEEYRDSSVIIALPPTQVSMLAAEVKEKLGLSFIRAAGDTESICERIAVLVGYRGGGALAIPLLEEGVDLILAGEGPEWETPEYIRDAKWQGRNKSLLLIGHAASEEPGMAYLAGLLQEAYPELPVRYIAGEPYLLSL